MHRSMRALWRRTQEWPGSSWLLWMLIIVCLWSVGLLILFDRPQAALLAPALVLFGLLALAHAVHRWRHPDWRNSEWWREHPMLAIALVGFHAPLPAVPARATERFSASVQFFVGAIFVLGGIGVALGSLVAS
jgi:hypothetical protein